MTNLSFGGWAYWYLCFKGRKSSQDFRDLLNLQMGWWQEIKHKLQGRWLILTAEPSAQFTPEFKYSKGHLLEEALQ